MSDVSVCPGVDSFPLPSHARTWQHVAARWSQLQTSLGCWLTSPWAAAISVAVMLWLIGSVSAFDAFLTLRYQESLSNMELNPICRWIMQLRFNKPVEGEAVALFLGLKMIGTVNVLIIIKMLFLWRPHWGLAVGAGVTAFQLMLAAYLLAGA
jgi:hypothetical protein